MRVWEMRQPEVARGTPVTSTSDLPSIRLAWHRVTSRPQRNGPDDDPVMVLGPHLFEHRLSRIGGAWSSSNFKP